MGLKSLWENNTSNTISFDHLDCDAEVDAVIIGGGITGVTTAELLCEEGFKVILLEGDKIGQNNTGRSTGNLYAPLDNSFSELLGEYEREDIKHILASRTEAIRRIKNNIKRFNIECEFEEVPWIRYSTRPETDDFIHKEYEIAATLGIEFEWLTDKSPELLWLGGCCGFKLMGQAQFNPYKYLMGLSQSIMNNHCRLYENSRVDEIKENGKKYSVHVNGKKIISTYVIEATHTPLGLSFFHTVLAPYREYGIAIELDEKLKTPGIYWGLDENNDILSLRDYSSFDKNYLILVGRPHKVGQGEASAQFVYLEKYLKSKYPTNQVLARWSGQHYRSTDFLPYIGKKDDGNIFIATGFSTSGLPYGVLAAMLIRNEILGIKKPYSYLYNPHRVNPLKSSKKFIKENLNVMKQYVKDYLTSEKVLKLQMNEGAIIGGSLEKLAVYKNDKGELSAFSALCPHMKCIVHWNKEESSWDCPCHGSRFTPMGEVLEGPSLKGLTPIDIKKS